MLVAVCCSVLVYLFFNKFIRRPTGLRAGVLPPRFCDTTETRERQAFSVCGGRETASLRLRSIGLNEFQSHLFQADFTNCQRSQPFPYAENPKWLNGPMIPFSMPFPRFPTSHDEQKIVPSSKQQWLDRPMKRPNGESVSTASRWHADSCFCWFEVMAFCFWNICCLVCLLFFVGWLLFRFSLW